MLTVLWAREHLRTSLSLFSATCSPRHAGTHCTSVETHLDQAISSSPTFLTATLGQLDVHLGDFCSRDLSLGHPITHRLAGIHLLGPLSTRNLRYLPTSGCLPPTAITASDTAASILFCESTRECCSRRSRRLRNEKQLTKGHCIVLYLRCGLLMHLAK